MFEIVQRTDDSDGGSVAAAADPMAWREAIGAFVIEFARLEALVLSYLEHRCAGGMHLARHVVANWRWPGQPPDRRNVRSFGRLSRLRASGLFSLATAISCRQRARHARRCLTFLSQDATAGAAREKAAEAYDAFAASSAWCGWLERAGRIREMRNELVHRLWSTGSGTMAGAGSARRGQTPVADRRPVAFLPPLALGDFMRELSMLIAEIEAGVPALPASFDLSALQAAAAGDPPAVLAGGEAGPG